MPPYDDARIIAGQGTVGLEIVEDLPDVATVVVPVGGGGLSAGVATAVKLLRPSARVVGVEPEDRRPRKPLRARAAGKPVEIPLGVGLADGLLAVQIGAVPFAHLDRYLDDDLVAVPDAALPRAMRRHLLERERLVVEPSGAACVAALLKGLIDVYGPTRRRAQRRQHHLQSARGDRRALLLITPRARRCGLPVAAGFLRVPASSISTTITMPTSVAPASVRRGPAPLPCRSPSRRAPRCT